MAAKELEYRGRKLIARQYANGWQIEIRPLQAGPIKYTVIFPELSEKPADSFSALPAPDAGQSVRPITASVFCISVGNQRVFDSGSEASRSPRPQRRLGSGIRSTEQTSWLSSCPYQFQQLGEQV